MDKVHKAKLVHFHNTIAFQDLLWIGFVFRDMGMDAGNIDGPVPARTSGQ